MGGVNSAQRWAVLGLVLGVTLSAVAFLLFQRFTPSASTTVQVDAPLVLKQVQQLSELVSVKYVVQKAVGFEQQKVPFGSEKLLLFVQAQVLGGIDLKELREQDVRRSEISGIVIRLPEPRVLHIVFNEKETKVWDRQITWWTPWVPYAPDLEQQARLEARKAIEASALEMGLLRDARENAEATIRMLLLNLGVTSVTFVHGS